MKHKFIVLQHRVDEPKVREIVILIVHPLVFNVIHDELDIRGNP